jgi:hypothetical protein
VRKIIDTIKDKVSILKNTSDGKLTFKDTDSAYSMIFERASKVNNTLFRMAEDVEIRIVKD